MTTAPDGAAPEWARQQLLLRAELDNAWREFAGAYFDAGHRLQPSGRPVGRDGADDFLESIFNWPTLYAVGGSDDLLDFCKHAWLGITDQLAELGLFHDRFEVGYDWFHLGEGLELFYNLCLADPGDPELVQAVTRFADLYLPDSEVGNYDASLNVVRTPHNGAAGPRPGIEDVMPRFGVERGELKPYGLPVHGLPGIEDWADLAGPGRAEAMAQAMQRRLGTGDVAINLSITGLVCLAWLMTGQDRYRDWIGRYVGGWLERASVNGGLLPDNVGPGGEVGENFDGSWYGGLYGWTWPHGVHSLAPAALIAGSAVLLSQADPSALLLARGVLEQIAQRSVLGTIAQTTMTMKGRWRAHFAAEYEQPLLLEPTRCGPQGWFDFQPPQVAFPIWLWYLSRAERDTASLQALRRDGGWDWRAVRQFREKEEAGHEDAWYAALIDGDVATFAAEILIMARHQVRERLTAMRSDDRLGFNQDRWHRLNPVVTEALVLTAFGAPQALYNGGLQHATLCYRDPDRDRVGLPETVAALVESIDPDRTVVCLSNLGSDPARVLVGAGRFAEHSILGRRVVSIIPDREPAALITDAEGQLSMIMVRLPAQSTVRLELRLKLHDHPGRLIGQGCSEACRPNASEA